MTALSWKWSEGFYIDSFLTTIYFCVILNNVQYEWNINTPESPQTTKLRKEEKNAGYRRNFI